VVVINTDDMRADMAPYLPKPRQWLFLHWLDLGVEAPHFGRWTYFKGGYENVYLNFDGTVRRSQGYSTTIVFDRAIEYVNDFEGRDDARTAMIRTLYSVDDGSTG